MEFINWLVAFNLGLFSTLHCLGMCGGIITALVVSGGTGSSCTEAHRYIHVFLYNLGRICSYTIAGALAGFAGANIAGIIVPVNGHLYLQGIAGVVLMMIGLHLAGWLPKLRHIESFGVRFWNWIQPAGRLFIPVNHPGKALVLGMIWGWLPCALVYSVLVWALTSGGMPNGALIMFAFGLGTLPGMLGTGLLGSRFTDTFRRGHLRVWAGIIIFLVGLVSLTMLHPDLQPPGMHSHHATVP